MLVTISCQSRPSSVFSVRSFNVNLLETLSWRQMHLILLASPVSLIHHTWLGLAGVFRGEVLAEADAAAAAAAAACQGFNGGPSGWAKPLLVETAILHSAVAAVCQPDLRL